MVTILLLYVATRVDLHTYVNIYCMTCVLWLCMHVRIYSDDGDCNNNAGRFGGGLCSYHSVFFVSSCMSVFIMAVNNTACVLGEIL